MKSQIRVSLAQFAPVQFQRAENAARMVDLIHRESREFGADLIVFPELATTGYIDPHTSRDLARQLYEASESVPGPTTKALSKAARETRSHVVFGVAERHRVIPDVLYNSAVLLTDEGQIAGVHHKVHAVHEEKNYFALGGRIDVFPTSIGAVGLQICYDVAFPELSRIQALRGAELILSIWAYVVPIGPPDSIAVKASTRAMENQVYFVGCNRSGDENGRQFYGHSAIAAPSGDLLAKSSTSAEDVVRATLDAADVSTQRRFLTIFRDRRPELYGDLCQPLEALKQCHFSP